jgi:MscS family membrane protein
VAQRARSMTPPGAPSPNRSTRSTRRAPTAALLLASALALQLPSARAAPPLPASQAAAPPSAGAAPQAPAVDASSDDTGEAAAPDSPRASMARFITLCRQGAYAEAAGYLELSPAQVAAGPELARKLKAVLDRHAWLDFERISARAEGDDGDGLPAYLEQIAELPGRDGVPEPVRLARRSSADGMHWRFTRPTVNRIEAWYAELDTRWLQEHLPALLLRPGPRELLWWQWLALVPLVMLTWLGGHVLSRTTLRLLSWFSQRSGGFWDRASLEYGRAPVTLVWTVVLSFFLVRQLMLSRPAEEFVHDALRGALLLAFFWILARGTDLTGKLLGGTPWSARHPAFDSLLPLASRLMKLIVYTVGVVAMLSELGYPVASLIAGFGIGGVAVALAARKSLENLFGAFSIGADQPFRVGDAIRADGVEGTVEQIGLRSTRIRTPDRTLITIPNGKLAEMRLESLTSRDRRRLVCAMGLAFGTSTTQMRQVLVAIERILREHPAVWPGDVEVHFKAIRESALELEAAASFIATDAEFRVIRQDVLLQILEAIEGAGAVLAYPTRTVHLDPDRAPTAAPRPEVSSSSN